MNRLFLIAGIAILIAALAFLNQGIKKASPTDADLQQQAQEQQEKANQAQGKSPEAVRPPASSPVPPPDALPAEETVGDPAKALHHLQVGWVYDEANQANPQTLLGPLQAIRDYVKSSDGTACAEIVNLDVPVEDRSPAAQGVNELGLSVDGSPAISGNLSETQITAPNLTKAINAAMGKK